MFCINIFSNEYLEEWTKTVEKRLTDSLNQLLYSKMPENVNDEGLKKVDEMLTSSCNVSSYTNSNEIIINPR